MGVANGCLILEMILRYDKEIMVVLKKMFKEIWVQNKAGELDSTILALGVSRAVALYFCFLVLNPH